MTVLASPLSTPGSSLASATTASVQPAAALDGCGIADASLSWGFRESWRAYITGRIANGEWETSDGATYEIPQFVWSDGASEAGELSGDGSIPAIQFTGAVRFTGHDGALDTTIANPRIELFDDATGRILLDVSGPTLEGDAVDAEGVDFVAIDLLGAELTPDADGVVTVTDAPTAITADGNAVFSSYPVGDAFDPVSFSFTLTDCAVDEPGSTPAPSETLAPAPTETMTTTPSEMATPEPSGATGVPVAGIAIGAIVFVAALAVAGWLIARARRARRAAAAD